jgi:amidophosphoribosyltransferase
MCGIVGALTFDAFEKKSEEKTRTEAMIFIVTQLLQMTVERGKDATGIAMLWADGNFSGLKMGIPSPQFIARFGEKETEFKGILKLLREYPKLCKVFMGHCRKASKGNSYDNKNNHPLQVGDIVFVHNGTLTNDDEIFKNLQIKRQCEVDSEAIGHLLNYYTDGGNEPFTKEVIEEVTKRLHGSYSVLAASGNNPFQAVQFVDGRPAEAVFVKPLKTVFVASEKKYLENVLFEYNKMLQLFNIATPMPYIKKADVEFKTLVDDSYAIWDLTSSVTPETTIDDLYDWGKTPLTANKIWGSAVKTYQSNNYYSSQNSYSTSKKTEVESSSPKLEDTTTKKTTTTCSGSADDDGDGDGLVWSKSLNKYKTQKGFKKSKSLGSVEINVEDGKVISLEKSNDEDDSSLKEVDNDKVENLLSNSAKIEELSLVKVSKAISEVKKTGAGSKTEIVEIDMTTDDPEAIAKAAEYVDQGLLKFEKDEEVIDALELSDISIIKSLPIFALANRIMKYVFSKGFIAGYTIAKKSTDVTTAENPDEIKELRLKLIAAKKNLAGLKTLFKIVMHCLQLRCKGNSVDAIDNMMGDGVKEIIRVSPPEFNFDNVFSAGDINKMSLLPVLKDNLEAKVRDKKE